MTVTMSVSLSPGPVTPDSSPAPVSALIQNKPDISESIDKLPGKTRDLNVFYDRGCSHVLFKSGVPGDELEAVKTRPGPIRINTAGDQYVMADDEWACLVPKADGSQQIMVGVSLKALTSTFPMAPPDKKDFLLSLKVPEFAGGEPDILLGILYESCHPLSKY